ncbi:MAG: nickel-dependent hydrogenase large subunit [Candidatus Aminicenantes bacterium]|nr:nickel-dependent hydrogenase large subunit [Candidatus Aminicenantes bacterium]
MKTISIDHLPRVEGNGGVFATIDGRVVSEVKLVINEGPRLIERLTVGKTPEEDVSIAPRICAICSVSHKNAVLRAMENALDVGVPDKVTLLRELMHMGEFIESHSLHVYYLALPDYVGFPNAIAMASKFPFEVKIALEMKQFGNTMMKLISGRMIHGENPVIGGFGRYPTREELVWVKNRAVQFMPFVFRTVELFCGLDYPPVPEADTVYACCEPGDGRYGLWGDEIILSTGEKIARDDYKSLTNEFLVPHSFCKRSRYKGNPYSVGALARVNVLGERLQGEAARMYKKHYNSSWKKNPLYHNAAQALEILYSFERVPELVDQILAIPENPPLASSRRKSGQGTGLVEAPRGLLIHHYEIKNGLVSGVDIITPTAQNAEDIERYCYIAAQKLLDDGQENKIRDRMDLVVRAFDPCISCSVHMAEVKRAPSDRWKKELAALREAGPVFVGVGQKDRSDDGAGLELASRMKELGVKDVYLEAEIEEDHILEGLAGRPLVFIDAININERPGKIVMLPLQQLFWNAVLSHRLLPSLTNRLACDQVKNAYVLGIQPESIVEGGQLSKPVRLALRKILKDMRGSFVPPVKPKS